MNCIGVMKNCRVTILLCGFCVFLLYKTFQQHSSVIQGHRKSALTELMESEYINKDGGHVQQSQRARGDNQLASVSVPQAGNDQHLQHETNSQGHKPHMMQVTRQQPKHPVQIKPAQPQTDKQSNQGQPQLPVQHQVQPQRETVHDSGPVPVLLMTYMRSGSSFLGDVLQINQDVIYLFEPVHAIQFAVRDKKEFFYLKKPSRRVDNFLDIALESITGFSTCNLDDVTLKMWDDGFLSRSKKAGEYHKCLKANPNKEFKSTQRECIEKVKTLCKNSGHVVMKIIRIPLYILEPLLKQIPRFKIIYLLRDPRATVKSQNKFGVVRSNFLQEDVMRFCNRVYKDVVTAEELNRKYPNRIKTVHYEDIAQDPIGESKSIYKFIGMNFTSTVEQKIRDMTSSGVDKQNCGALCTHKSDSSKLAHAWRKDMPMHFVKTVDNSCQPVYSRLGYRSVVNEEDLRNLNNDLKLPIPKEDDYRFA